MPRDVAMRTGLLFGTFDGIHPGHRAMLCEARSLVDHLTVVIPTDSTVIALKHRAPRYSWTQRAAALRATGLVDDIREGDRELGTYSMIPVLHPSVIFLGYDQDDLRADLLRFFQDHGQDFPLRTLSPYQPDRYKSSLITPI